jgi:monooxygenase
LSTHVDFLVIGAGLSGIDAAYHVATRFPDSSYTVLEMRDAIGGTWDLFRYPGIRSDSDMHTLGFRWKPWRGKQAIADGADIRAYLREAAAEHGIDQHVRFRHKVLRAEFSTSDAQWKVTAERTDTGELVELTAGFVFSTSGYYRYDEGFTPELDGIENFHGHVVHPQFWPEDLDYVGKRVVVIGSGATAITLVPSLAKTGAGHVTMLQRSPSYVMSAPLNTPLGPLLDRLPEKVRTAVIRSMYLTSMIGIYEFCRARPKEARFLLRKQVEAQLPDHVDVDTHFKPRYEPWDERLCVVPNGDLFKALKGHAVDIVTDHIARFTERGILLKSGQELEADIVITATGLNLQAFGGITMAVDGKDVHLPDTMAFKGMMLSDIPNLVYIIGYTNASWTLKADLVCDYAMRMIAHMRATGKQIVVPRRDPSVSERPFLDFNAGYVLRSVDQLPRQGDREPWRLKMNYFKDLKVFGTAVTDPALDYLDPAPARVSTTTPAW